MVTISDIQSDIETLSVVQENIHDNAIRDDMSELSDRFSLSDYEYELNI